MTTPEKDEDTQYEITPKGIQRLLDTPEGVDVETVLKWATKWHEERNQARQERDDLLDLCVAAGIVEFLDEEDDDHG